MGSRRLLAALVAALCFAVCVGSAQASRFVHFKSPSGNIDCTVGTGGGGGPDSASCMVRTASWPRLPAKPRSCMLDWAPTEVDLSGTRTYLGSCRGDIGPLCIGGIRCSTLGYGRTLTVGRIRCVSAVAGVTCRRTDGRRVGFRVAREGYRIYR